jgi:CRISPR-associated protein Csm4
MESLRITLQPLSAFGSRPLGDMLFGQLCWAVRNRLGKSELNQLLEGYTQGNPWAVVSDALPAGFLPRPCLPGHWFDAIAGTDRKAAKKRTWLPLEQFDTPVESWLDHCKSPVDLGGSLPEAHPQPHNTINRATGTTGEGQFAPYAMTQHWYGSTDTPSPQLNVYVVLDQTRLNRPVLVDLFQDMGAFGFGRDAGIGLGKFEVTGVDSFDLPMQDDSDAWMTLAPCAPQGLGFDAGRSFYQVFTRFGRHGDIGARLDNPFNPDCSLGLWGNLEASFRHSEAMSNRSGSNGYH